MVITGVEPPKIRRRRTIDAAHKYSNQTNANQLEAGEQVFPTNLEKVDGDKNNEPIQSVMKDGHYEDFYNNETVASIHTFTLTKLKHYSMYRITVQACRDFHDKDFTVDTHCSNVVIETLRTDKIGMCVQGPLIIMAHLH